MDQIHELIQTYVSGEALYQKLTKEYEELVKTENKLIKHLSILEVDYSKKTSQFMSLKEEQKRLEEQVNCTAASHIHSPC
jgi:hypothetical protein